MVDQPSGAEKLEERFPGKYLSLTSYKRDGTGVSTPVWFVIDEGRLLVMTDPQSFKVRRIRRNPNVTIAPCTATGRLRGEPTPAQAEVLPDSERARAHAPAEPGVPSGRREIDQVTEDQVTPPLRRGS